MSRHINAEIEVKHIHDCGILNKMLCKIERKGKDVVALRLGIDIYYFNYKELITEISFIMENSVD